MDGGLGIFGSDLRRGGGKRFCGLWQSSREGEKEKKPRGFTFKLERGGNRNGTREGGEWEGGKKKNSASPVLLNSRWHCRGVIGKMVGWPGREKPSSLKGGKRNRNGPSTVEKEVEPAVVTKRLTLLKKKRDRHVCTNGKGLQWRKRKHPSDMKGLTG